jgi:hypothetical protein
MTFSYVLANLKHVGRAMKEFSLVGFEPRKKVRTTVCEQSDQRHLDLVK